MHLSLVKNGCTHRQAVQIKTAKEKVFGRQFVICKSGDWYTVHDAETLRTKQERRDIVHDSICPINDSSFLSHECLICQRYICKWNIYKNGAGPR